MPDARPAIALLLSCSLIATSPAEEPAEDADDGLAVTRVVLYSAGVGYFEHHGTIAGDASVELQFTTEQINDVLKSLIVLDQGGRVAGVTYPSRDPLARLLGSFAIDLSGDPSMAGLLRQLRGAAVRVTLPGDRTLRGAVIALEQRPQASGDTVYQEVVLTLATDDGLQTVALRDVRSLSLVSEHLQQELDKALAAMAEARNAEKKTVTVNFAGQNERAVALGYLVETPVWKTSYRLLLGEDDEQPTQLQGWAIVENQTELDWNDVELSLVSGRPISFVEELYEPIYIERPVVQPERYASLGPTSYRDGLQDKQEQRQFARKAARRGPGASGGAGDRAESLASRAPAADAEREMADKDMLGEAQQLAQSMQSVAVAEELGALFRYQVGSVDLPRRRSAMLPIVGEAIELDRLSIYNRQTLGKHPLRGARLRNSTGKHLLQGPITVVDSGAYAGDARIEDLPPGQERLISYAVDLDVNVVNEDQQQDSELLTGVISDGVLRLQRRYRRSHSYVFHNQDEKARTLLVEHPRLPGWELVDSPDPVESTEQLHRFQDNLKADESVKLSVHQQRLGWEQVQLLHGNVERLIAFARNERLPEDVREAVAKAAALHRAVSLLQQQIQEQRRDIQEIAQEQNRIRSNMRTVDRNSAYYNRLLKKLDQQETRIEALRLEQENLEEQLHGKRRALADYLHGLKVGG